MWFLSKLKQVFLVLPGQKVFSLCTQDKATEHFVDVDDIRLGRTQFPRFGGPFLLIKLLWIFGQV
jgi:hypothetical protein